MTVINKPTQAEFGKAFEWAVGCAIQRKTGITIAMNAYSNIAQYSYDKMNEKTKNAFIKAADVTIMHLIAKEATLLHSVLDKRIEFNSDNAGKYGDVRDILLYIGDKVLGISCKHNHEALKHSRLSASCDFVKVWGIDSNGCSVSYWNRVKPLFAKLAKLRKDSNRTMLWSDVEDKAQEYYWPLLDAWADEIKILCAQSEEKQAAVCKAIISYLIGKHDFYKVIKRQKHVSIQGFNFNNTLSIKRTKYPNSINAINNRNGGQYSKTIVFNHGYSINFRIHSASSKVEASLKFDINAIGLPVNDVYQHSFDID